MKTVDELTEAFQESFARLHEEMATLQKSIGVLEEKIWELEQEMHNKQDRPGPDYY
jgi:phage shock protein A